MKGVQGWWALACLGAWLVLPVAAQEIEPRAFSNAPIGTNFLLVGYARTEGGLAFDPSLPISDPKLEVQSSLLGYARVIDIGGQSGKVDLIVPYTWLSGTALLNGEPISREVDGLSDARLRFSTNFVGAPALDAAEFANYRQDLILGASLQISAPTGQYDNTRLVNIGTNRWYFRPELGASQALGPWILEVAGNATFYTDNDDFYGGQRREQEPIYALRSHLIYSFRPGLWASVDGTWFNGGRTSVNDEWNQDLQRNWRAGATLALPLSRHHAVKLYASRGVSARTGNSYDLFGLIFQYRWGEGQ